MLKLFICQICGEPQLAEEPPTECQFCGAPNEYLIEDVFSPIWGTKLTEQEQKDVESVLALEVNATAYYLDVSKAHEKYSKYNRLFKGLARIEKEHAEVAAKILGVPLPEFSGERSRGSIGKDLERAKQLESGAAVLYKQFLARGTNEHIMHFFHALVHAESGHLSHLNGELKGGSQRLV